MHSLGTKGCYVGCGICLLLQASKEVDKHTAAVEKAIQAAKRDPSDKEADVVSNAVQKSETVTHVMSMFSLLVHIRMPQIRDPSSKEARESLSVILTDIEENGRPCIPEHIDEARKILDSGEDGAATTAEGSAKGRGKGLAKGRRKDSGKGSGKAKAKDKSSGKDNGEGSGQGKAKGNKCKASSLANLSGFAGKAKASGVEGVEEEKKTGARAAELAENVTVAASVAAGTPAKRRKQMSTSSERPVSAGTLLACFKSRLEAGAP